MNDIKSGDNCCSEVSKESKDSTRNLGFERGGDINVPRIQVCVRKRPLSAKGNYMERLPSFKCAHGISTQSIVCASLPP